MKLKKQMQVEQNKIIKERVYKFRTYSSKIIIYNDE